jgi:hypothetical protein
MSIVFRTQKCLTIYHLTRAWGLELAKGGGEPERHVHDLTHILMQILSTVTSTIRDRSGMVGARE